MKLHPESFQLFLDLLLVQYLMENNKVKLKTLKVLYLVFPMMFSNKTQIETEQVHMLLLEINLSLELLDHHKIVLLLWLLFLELLQDKLWGLLKDLIKEKMLINLSNNLLKAAEKLDLKVMVIVQIGQFKPKKEDCMLMKSSGRILKTLKKLEKFSLKLVFALINK